MSLIFQFTISFLLKDLTIKKQKMSKIVLDEEPRNYFEICGYDITFVLLEYLFNVFLKRDRLQCRLVCKNWNEIITKLEERKRLQENMDFLIAKNFMNLILHSVMDFYLPVLFSFF